MAYGRRGMKRKRGYNRRKPWYDKKYSAFDLGVKALKGVKAIRRLINVEKKYCDTTSSTAMSTTPVVVSLNQLATGDGPEQRDGNSIKPQYLVVKTASFPSTSAGQTEARFVIVRDTQQIADTTPAVTDVFDSADIASLRNEANKGRFQILFDRQWITTSTQSRPMLINTNVRLTGHIRFNGSAGTDIQKGGLYVMYWSNQATNTASMDMKCRMFFTDN